MTIKNPHLGEINKRPFIFPRGRLHPLIVLGTTADQGWIWHLAPLLIRFGIGCRRVVEPVL